MQSPAEASTVPTAAHPREGTNANSTGLAGCSPAGTRKPSAPSAAAAVWVRRNHQGRRAAREPHQRADEDGAIALRRRGARRRAQRTGFPTSTKRDQWRRAAGQALPPSPSARQWPRFRLQRWHSSGSTGLREGRELAPASVHRGASPETVCAYWSARVPVAAAQRRPVRHRHGCEPVPAGTADRTSDHADADGHAAAPKVLTQVLGRKTLTMAKTKSACGGRAGSTVDSQWPGAPGEGQGSTTRAHSGRSGKAAPPVGWRRGSAVGRALGRGESPARVSSEHPPGDDDHQGRAMTRYIASRLGRSGSGDVIRRSRVDRDRRDSGVAAACGRDRYHRRRGLQRRRRWWAS